jgi:cyclopropane-fatty-acyl-phospholipid synthase
MSVQQERPATQLSTSRRDTHPSLPSTTRLVDGSQPKTIHPPHVDAPITSEPIQRNEPTRWIDRIGRERIVSLLEQVTHARLVLHEPGRSSSFGPPSANLTIELHVHHPRVWGELLLGGTLAAGETYMRGLWSTNHLVALMRVLLRTQSSILPTSSPWEWLAHRVAHAFRRNSRRTARQNIADHYDLGNDFFRLFLDDTMMYSAGFFSDEQTTLEEASRAKVDRLARKLSLMPGMEVIEIGSGWGYLACHLAREFGCRVTTTTLSREQYEMTTQRIHREGLGERVRVLMADYRDLRGQFDRLISVEMIEAVGHAFLDTYFQRCSQLLKSTGKMALQAITIPDEFLAMYRRNVDFIQRYIFPGGELPSLGQIARAVAGRTDLRLVHSEDLPGHYARTLHEWRKRFGSSIHAIRELGFDEDFIRRWDYYFAYCEAAFRERTIGLSQIIFEKPHHGREGASQLDP